MEHTNSEIEIQYTELLAITKERYQDAINNLPLTEDQAFTFTYDEMELLLEGNEVSSWQKVAGYTALFICLDENGGHILEDNQFDNDMITQLKQAYKNVDTVLATVKISELELHTLKKDIATIQKNYIEKYFINGPL